MKYLREELTRLIITAVITAAVIAVGAWYEHRTGMLQSLITSDEQPASEVLAPAE